MPECPCNWSSMTLLSRSATCTDIKPQMTLEPFRRTSALGMKLVSGSLTLLVFISAVYSAAMREGGEDLLRFLKDAFEINLPLDRTESTPLAEMDLATERILDTVHPTDQTAECKAPEIIVNSADFSSTTPKPNLVELPGVAEERSTESRNSDSRLAERASAEDSREEGNSKRLQLRTTLTDTLLFTDTLQEHYGISAESVSLDWTDADIDVTEGSNKHTNKATVVVDISSQEMEKGRYRPSRIQKMLETDSAVVTGRHGLSSPIGFTGRVNLQDQPGTDKHQQERRKSATDLDSPESVDTQDTPDLDDSEEHGIKAKRAMLNYSRELADGTPGCTETSGEHPVEENNVDQKIQKDTMSYQNQLRKICPTKRIRASNNPRAQLDWDSPERVNSAPLDRDNSAERLEDHTSFPL